MTPYVYPARLVRVVDADTLVLSIDLGFHIRKQDFVRLYGVNAPEIFGANASEAGKAAKQFVTEWLANATTLAIRSNKYDEREKYGRILATIHKGGEVESLNDALVREGHAVASA